MSQDVLSLTFKKQFDNRHYVHLNILGYTCSGLLDSGATRTVANSNFVNILKRLGVKTQKLKRMNISTADGTSHCIKELFDVPMQFNNQFYIIPVLHMPGLAQTLILGRDFFDKFGISFQFTSDLMQEPAIVNTITHQSVTIMSKEDLNPDQNKALANIITEIRNKIGIGLGRTKIIKHTIDTGDSKPVHLKQYNFSPVIRKEIEKELDEMLDKDVVEPSYSPWCSPLVMVRKPNGGNRLCLDSRQLNKVTKRDTYPLPRVSSILDNLRNAKFLSTIDLKSAFWQIELEENSKEKTAFAVPGRGLFQFKVMPFGLVNASQSQQRLMDILFHALEGKVWAYLDDIIVCSENFDEHIKILKDVTNILKEAGLTINVEKCKFARPSLRFLGYIIDKDGLRTDPDKVSAIINFPRPRKITDLKRFIGIASWYRRFVKDFATIAAPLHNLTKGKRNKKFVWSDEADKAFVHLKTLLTTTPVISCPNFTKPFIIQCDASNKGIGAVLCQKLNNIEQPISYLSRKLNEREQLYSTSERELLSIVYAIEKFRPYIDGTHFTIVTDHSALKMLHKMKDPHGRLARWAMKIQQFSFDIIHRPGRYNIVPDALSRSINALTDNSYNILILDKHKDDWYKKKVAKIEKTEEVNSDWQVKNGLLYKKICLKQFPDKTCDWKLYIPKSLKGEILKRCHDNSTAGHLGVRKTLFRIKQLYFWPNMLTDVKQYVGRCDICARAKVSQQLPLGQMGQHRTVTKPWQIISMDLMGPFPKSKNCNTMLLVITCLFSKFILLFPLRTGKADKICEILESQFLLFGIPQAIICDNGKQFDSHIFKNLIKQYNSQIWFTPHYHPQSNPTERVNRVIGTMISSYMTSKKHNEWDVHLQKFAHAIRTSIHETTQYTPSFLFFGRETSIPATSDTSTHIVSNEKNNENFISDTREYLTDLQSRNAIYKAVETKLKTCHAKSLKSYNEKRRIANFQIGDVVWKRTKYLSKAGTKFMAKLAPKFEKAIIVKKLSANVFHLNNSYGKPIGVWHSKDLKPLWQGYNNISS
ncbi:hypothetical protein O3G_MSEX000180 [Manduca sexta]|nr:hypothetical protein O3G_MSEX000180 [Manduca sexta]